jgi:hypothetical protein
MVCPYVINVVKCLSNCGSYHIVNKKYVGYYRQSWHYVPTNKDKCDKITFMWSFT